MSDILFKANISWIVATILCVNLRIIWRTIQNNPRTLVSANPISVGLADTPCGIVAIDGVEVRVGDTVILTNQTDTSKNGAWTVSNGPWRSQVRSTRLGDWLVTNSGELWRKLVYNQWMRVNPGDRLLPLGGSDFAPNNPAEAAAYLTSLGILPNQIHTTRIICIDSLVVEGFLTRTQGDLLLAKPENLTPEFGGSSGVIAVVPNSTWVSQVFAYMNAILNIHVGFTHFQGDLQEVSNQLPKHFEKGHISPQSLRRSRYTRDPVI